MATTYTNITQNKVKTFFWISFFVLFIVGLGYVMSRAFNMYWIFGLSLIIAFFQAMTAYWWSDKVALSVSRAHEITKSDAPELYRIVENLTITAGLPMPKVYIIEDAAMNAFATGRNPKHASIAVTRGLLDKLDKPELEGVIAHELSHVGNYDILLSTAVVILSGIVVMVSDLFFRVGFWGGFDDDNDNQTQIIFLIAGMVLAILSPIFATMIQLAISRKREFLADASGALLTRNPNGLADALEAIENDSKSMDHINKATAHMYIESPLKNQGDRKSMFSSLFSTHPDTAERIRRLREMAI